MKSLGAASPTMQAHFRRRFYKDPTGDIAIRKVERDGTLVFGVSDVVVKRASAAASRRIRQTLDGMKL